MYIAIRVEMMTADKFLSTILRPSLQVALPLISVGVLPAATQMLLTIAGQEGAWVHRRQIGGPARGFWQFEKSGGVRGVMTHARTADRTAKLAAALSIPFTDSDLYEAVAWNDVLAAGMARLLLLSDDKAIPLDAQEAWTYYVRTWRPGKPHTNRWQGNWDASLRAIAAEYGSIA